MFLKTNQNHSWTAKTCFALSLGRLEICYKKNYTTLFSGKGILHTENAEIVTIFASNKTA